MANLVAPAQQPEIDAMANSCRADPHSADFVDDGAAAACFYPRLIVYL